MQLALKGVDVVRTESRGSLTLLWDLSNSHCLKLSLTILFLPLFFLIPLQCPSVFIILSYLCLLYVPASIHLLLCSRLYN